MLLSTYLGYCSYLRIFTIHNTHLTDHTSRARSLIRSSRSNKKKKMTTKLLCSHCYYMIFARISAHACSTTMKQGSSSGKVHRRDGCLVTYLYKGYYDTLDIYSLHPSPGPIYSVPPLSKGTKGHASHSSARSVFCTSKLLNHTLAYISTPSDEKPHLLSPNHHIEENVREQEKKNSREIEGVSRNKIANYIRPAILAPSNAIVMFLVSAPLCRECRELVLHMQHPCLTYILAADNGAVVEYAR